MSLPGSVPGSIDVPDSFKPGSRERLVFKGWIKYLKVSGNKNRPSNALNLKEHSFYMKFGMLKKVELFETENIYDSPVFSIKLDSNCSFNPLEKKLRVVIYLKKRKPSFVLRCKNRMDFETLIEILKFNGLIEIPSTTRNLRLDMIQMKSGSASPNSFKVRQIQSKEPKDWTTFDIMEWSKDLIVGPQYNQKLYDIASTYFYENKVDGKKLLSWKRRDFLKLAKEFKGVITTDQFSGIRRQVLRLKMDREYNPSQNYIQEKAIGLLKSKNGEIGVKDILNLMQKFGSVENIRAKILEIMYGSNIIWKHAGVPKSELGSNNFEKPKNVRFKVKVNIVENVHSDQLKRLRMVLGKLIHIKDVINPFLGRNQEDIDTRFGIFHSSISIGQLYLEWVDGSVVIIRRACSENAILCCDVAEITVKDGIKFASKLAKEIYHWNGHFRYENFGSRGMNDESTGNFQMKGNCQFFVLHILQFLGLDWKLEKRVEAYAQNMKYNGHGEMIFKFEKEFFKRFSPVFGKLKEFRPKSHRDLDEFVQKIFESCPNFEEDFNQDYCLLKGFDRAYWLRYRFDEKNRDYRPAKRNKKVSWKLSGCPFTKPKEKKRTVPRIAPSLRDPMFQNGSECVAGVYSFLEKI